MSVGNVDVSLPTIAAQMTLRRNGRTMRFALLWFSRRGPSSRRPSEYTPPSCSRPRLLRMDHRCDIYREARCLKYLGGLARLRHGK